MKRNCFAVITLSIAAAAFIGCGCHKNESSMGEAPKAAEASAEKNSFKEVTSKLDAGGNLYFYLSTEEWLDGLSDKMAGWREFPKSIPGISDDDQKNIAKGFDVGTSLIKNSGIEDISGVGISSLALDKGFYRTKFVLHHYKGKDSGYLWKLMGTSPHPLNGLDFLPATTAFATFSDMNAPLAWAALDKELAKSGIPGAAEALQQIPDQFAAVTGLKLDKVLASMGNEYGLVITLDDSKKISVPVGSDPLQVPEPGIMIVIKVKDDVIFNRVDEVLKANKQVIRTDKGGLKMRTMPIPLPLPITLRPSIARSGDYLFIATTDALIQEALAVKDGKKPGLKSSDEFKKLAKGLPTEGNQFSYISQRFGQTWKEVQTQVMENRGEDKAGQTELIKKLMNMNDVAYAYNVSANTDEGWIGVGNGNQNAAKLVLLPAVVIPVVAAIAVPNFIKARGTAQENSCINNLRIIDGAKQMWALESKKTANEVPTWADLKPYLGRPNSAQLICPKGGTYQINGINHPPTCSIPGHVLP